MATQRHRRPRRTTRSRPWWRRAAVPVVAATIAALFAPLPSYAAPAAPPAAPPAPAAPAPVPAVPDAGSRPVPLGTLLLPGRRVPTTPAAVTGSGSRDPLVRDVERRRADVAAVGDRLIQLGQDRDLAVRQAADADGAVLAARAVVTVAEQRAADAAAAALMEAAGLPPGADGSGLAGLDELARIQRGDTAAQDTAARQLAVARAAADRAAADRAAARARAADLRTRWTRLQADLTRRQSALQRLEQRYADALARAEAAEAARDLRLGAGYLDGAAQGRGADLRALAALRYALAQRGDPYVWSEEGPDEFDCSGLMWAAYRQPAAGSTTLPRVSRDQYWATRANAVDRYSLLPGDLLFFSSSQSWTGIHHVAMYAGSGMMVEAPRSGLRVRLVPVRWGSLFQATRVYGSVDGPVRGPDLGTPDPVRPAPRPPSTPPTSKPPSTPPTSKPPTTPPTSRPPTTPPTSRPPTTPPTTPPTSPPTSPPPSGGVPSATPAPTTSGSPAPGSPAPGTPSGGPSSPVPPASGPAPASGVPSGSAGASGPAGP